MYIDILYYYQFLMSEEIISKIDPYDLEVSYKKLLQEYDKAIIDFVFYDNFKYKFSKEISKNDINDIIEKYGDDYYHAFIEILSNYQKYEFKSKQECVNNLLVIFRDNYDVAIDLHKINTYLEELDSKCTTRDIQESRNSYKQHKFREAIIERDKKCIITGNGELMCQAAHIKPYCLCEDNEKFDPNNGILLDSSYHKLFDNNLIKIDKNTSKLSVSNDLCKDKYNTVWQYNNKILDIKEGSKKYL